MAELFSPEVDDYLLGLLQDIQDQVVVTAPVHISLYVLSIRHVVVVPNETHHCCDSRILDVIGSR